MKARLTLSILLLGLAMPAFGTTADLEEAARLEHQTEPRRARNFLHAAHGPAAGRLTLALGVQARAYASDDGYEQSNVPSVEVQLALGVSDAWDYRLKLTTMFVLYNELDTGFRHSFDLDGFSFAVGGSANAVVLPTSVGVVAFIGGGPNAAISVGGSDLQFTAGLAVLAYGALGGALTEAGQVLGQGGFLFRVEPSIAVEYDVGGGLALYGKAELPIWGARDLGDGVLLNPTLSFGAMW